MVEYVKKKSIKKGHVLHARAHLEVPPSTRT